MLKVITVLSLAVLVGMAGLFLLAKSRKENLGRLHVLASWFAITFGMASFIFIFTAGAIKFMQECRHGNDMADGHHMNCCEGHGHDADCGGMHERSCSKNSGSCEHMRGHGCGENYSHESCSKGHGGMKMDGNCCQGNDEEIEVKEVIIKDESGKKNIPEIKVEVEGKTK
jgi:hypothetical protein